MDEILKVIGGLSPSIGTALGGPVGGAVGVGIKSILGTITGKEEPEKQIDALKKNPELLVKLELETAKLENEQLKILADYDQSHIEAGVEDNKSGKGGYRWAAGWLCVASLGYAWIIRDLIMWLFVALDITIPVLPNPPVEMQYTMLLGMLGLAGVRSFDLAKGSRK